MTPHAQRIDRDARISVRTQGSRAQTAASILEVHRMCRNGYRSTGRTRRDSVLHRILDQRLEGQRRNFEAKRLGRDGTFDLQPLS